MALQPHGPLPASTYWRRRLVLLAVLVVLLVLVLKACGGDDPKPSALTVPKATPTAKASPAKASPAKPSPVPSPTPTRSPVPAAPKACSDAVLQVTVESDAATYKSGAAPRFTLTVRNTGTVACTRALGPDAVELRVFSGEDRIWSSDDCNDAKGQGVLTLPAGQARATTVQWPGKRTKPGCDVGDVAQPGTYRVSARVGDLVRQGSVFRIT